MKFWDKVKHCSPANILAESKRQRISAILDNGFTSWLLFFATCVALYNDIMLWAPKQFDVTTGIVSAVCLLFFLMEMVLTLLSKAGYFGRLYFWLDVMACYSLLPDMLLFAFQVTLGTPSTLAVARAGRMARTGMRLGRLRFTKMLSFLSGFSKDSSETNDPAFMGRVLMEVTTRKIVAGLLIMLIAIPFSVTAIQEDDQAPIDTLLSVDLITNSTLAVQMLRQLEHDYHNIIYLSYQGTLLTSVAHDHLRFFQIQELLSKSAKLQFDISDMVYDTALKALIGTTFTVLLLLLGTFLLSRDVNKMVIVPIEKLKNTIEKHTLDFDSLDRSGGAKTNMIEDALRKVSAIMQVNLNLSNTIESAAHGTAAMDEVVRTMQAEKGVLLWEDAADEKLVITPWEEVTPDSFTVICSRTSTRQDAGMTDDDMPEHVSVVCDVVKTLRRPIVVNSRADLKQLGQGPAPKLTPQGNKELRSQSIVATPLNVRNRFVGIVYLERSKVYKKDMSKFFGEDVSSQRKSRRQSIMPSPARMGRKASIVGGLQRKNSLMGGISVRPKGNYTQKDVHILHAVANQVAIVLQLTRSVADDVGAKWTATMAEVEQAKKRQEANEAQAAKKAQKAAKEAAILRAQNFRALLADADIPHSPLLRGRQGHPEKGATPGGRRMSLSILNMGALRSRLYSSDSGGNIGLKNIKLPGSLPGSKTGSRSLLLRRREDKQSLSVDEINIAGQTNQVSSKMGSSASLLSVGGSNRLRRASVSVINQNEQRRESVGSEIRRHFRQRMMGSRGGTPPPKPTAASSSSNSSHTPLNVNRLGVLSNQMQRRSSIAISSLRFSSRKGTTRRFDGRDVDIGQKDSPSSVSDSKSDFFAQKESAGSSSDVVPRVPNPTPPVIEITPDSTPRSASLANPDQRSSSTTTKPDSSSGSRTPLSKSHPPVQTEQTTMTPTQQQLDPIALTSLRCMLEGAGVGARNPPIPVTLVKHLKDEAMQCNEEAGECHSGSNNGAQGLETHIPTKKLLQSAVVDILDANSLPSTSQINDGVYNGQRTLKKANDLPLAVGATREQNETFQRSDPVASSATTLVTDVVEQGSKMSLKNVEEMKEMVEEDILIEHQDIAKNNATKQQMETQSISQEETSEKSELQSSSQLNGGMEYGTGNATPSQIEVSASRAENADISKPMHEVDTHNPVAAIQPSFLALDVPSEAPLAALAEDITFSKPLTLMTVEELLAQKKRIKRKVVRFDHSFVENNGRPPSIKEKAPMRAYYQQYRAVKGMLELNDTVKARSTPQEEKHTSDMPHSSVESYEKLDYLTARLTRLNKERRMLNIALYHFQNEFQKQHGRKPTSAQDQKPMRADYRRFKLLSKEKESLENRVAQLPPPTEGHAANGGNE